MAATLLTLAEIGWKPIGPDVWRSDGQELWIRTSPRGTEVPNTWQLYEEVERTIVRRMWRHAGSHDCGEGRDEGVNISRAKRQVAWHRN